MPGQCSALLVVAHAHTAMSHIAVHCAPTCLQTKMQTMVKNNIKAAAKREKSMWARAFGSKKEDAATDATAAAP